MKIAGNENIRSDMLTICLHQVNTSYQFILK